MVGSLIKVRESTGCVESWKREELMLALGTQRRFEDVKSADLSELCEWTGRKNKNATAVFGADLTSCTLGNRKLQMYTSRNFALSVICLKMSLMALHLRHCRSKWSQLLPRTFITFTGHDMSKQRGNH